MSFSAYDSIKEQIRDAIDIVDLVGRFVPLQRSGRNFVGKCPWHDDSRPSLQVNPERQSFKCWVCDIGGDIFSFMQQIENVDFREAMKILAEMAGVELPKYKRPQPQITAPDGVFPGSDLVVEKKSLYDAMQWIQKSYHECLLNDPVADEARAYLKDRGIDTQSIERFGIGFASPEYDFLLKKLKKVEPRQLRVMELTGTLVRPEGENRLYDRFRGRLIFPIRDTMDRVVAFGGRILPNSNLQSKAKYLNSPETEIFSKHRMLYGLDLARHTMRKSRRALIMEGYTDCIMAHQNGLSDAVAVLGTALGSEHIRVLKRFVDKMVLVLDGDAAGQKRTNEVIELFIAQGANLYVLTLPSGADPCDYIEANGSEAFEDYLKANERDGLEHFLRTRTEGIDLGNVVEASGALNKVLEVFALLPQEAVRADNEKRLWFEMSIRKIARKFAMEENVIRERLSSLRKTTGSEKANYRTEPGYHPGYEDSFEEESDPFAIDFDPEFAPDSLERELLEFWLAEPDFFYDFLHEITENEDLLVAPLTKRIFKLWCDMTEKGIVPSFESLIVHYDDPRMKNFLIELDESGSRKGLRDFPPEAKELVGKQLMQGLINRHARRNRPKLINELRDESRTEEEKKRLFLELLESQKKRIGK